VVTCEELYQMNIALSGFLY